KGAEVRDEASQLVSQEVYPDRTVHLSFRCRVCPPEIGSAMAINFSDWRSRTRRGGRRAGRMHRYGSAEGIEAGCISCSNLWWERVFRPVRAACLPGFAGIGSLQCSGWSREIARIASLRRPSDLLGRVAGVSRLRNRTIDVEGIRAVRSSDTNEARVRRRYLPRNRVLHRGEAGSPLL